jgi:hypothetical protein
MNISYTMYEADHPRSAAAQREADTRAGELAASVARLGRSLRRTVTRNQSSRRTAPAPAGACFVPRPR